MTPAHAYSYVHIIYIFDKFVHHAALRTSRASLKMRADCKLLHVHFAPHHGYIIATILLQEYEKNVTIL